MTAPRVDTLIIGGGVAGLFAALHASRHGTVALVTKAELDDSNTNVAQGGIASVLFDDDTIQSHIADTLGAGDGLCDEQAVALLCTEGPQRLRELIEIGARFDTDPQSGELLRGREAAHSNARIVHAGGDATGAEVQRALCDAVRRSSKISVHTTTRLRDLVVYNGHVVGATVRRHNSELVFSASAVILATGGAGRLFRHTTNPEIATGDGVAAAFRAGALIRDAEMFQFHPTLLAQGTPTLITEALRGEGALLRNVHGERFMPSYHPEAELAPRDVVARAIATEMSLQDGQPVLLDATAIDSTHLQTRFPTINRACREAGIDFTREHIPVTPAAHFWMGGIATSVNGATSLPGLWAIGEAACTGVHGANRLASNSLLEGLVFSARAVNDIATGQFEPFAHGQRDFRHSRIVALSDPRDDVTHMPIDPQITPIHSTGNIDDIGQLMWDHAGLVRDHHGLRVGEKQLYEWLAAPSMNDDVTNLLTCGRILTAAAIERTESRGAHARADYPFSDPSQQTSLYVQGARK